MSEIEYKKALKDIIAAQARMNAGDNRAYTDYREAEFRAFDALYDSSTIDGINAIPVPESILSKRKSYTGQAEYILTLRSGQYEKEGKIELAICCLKKANDLRQISEVNSYRKYDYMRLVELLKKARRFDEARIEEKKINRFFDEEEPTVDDIKRKLLTQCRQLDKKSDLVEMSSCNACCEVCAKYRGRVFSLYGFDKRFPLFPEDYHDECGIIPFPFIYGISTPHYCADNIIKYSKRPFIDDRTIQEKKDYVATLQRKEENRIRELDKQDYDWLWEFMPEICPKSFSSYRRMKNANTDIYKKIVAQAIDSGYVFKAQKAKKSTADAKPIQTPPNTTDQIHINSKPHNANGVKEKFTNAIVEVINKERMSNTAVILWLIFFYPIGLFLMWQKTDWKKKTKNIITVIVVLVFILSSIGSMSD